MIEKPRVVLPSIFTATALEPLRGFVDETVAAPSSGPGILDASLFTGFAYADSPDCGACVVVVADGDPSPARAFAADLAGRYHAGRHALFASRPIRSLKDGIEHAIGCAREARAPVVVLEHADRMNDSTWCLAELVRRGASRVAVPYLWDPAAAERAASAGVGSAVSLRVGGHSSARAGSPVPIDGRVVYAGEKRYVGTGPMRLGSSVDPGLTALVDTGELLVWLTSRSLSAIDTDPFVQFGLDPMDFDIVLLRSKTHFRAGWEPVASEIIIVDTPDWGTADLASLPYRRLPRGIFPVTSD